jgi:NTP pyrophosphatase (non-canonical NTP hydrolase)
VPEIERLIIINQITLIEMKTKENAGNGHSLHPMLANGFLNQIANELHQKAKKKGFWDEQREIGTLLMLIVSELSEALEADRKNKKANYKQLESDIEQMNEFDNEIEFKKLAFEYSIKDTFEDEIADVFIRLFDLVGYLNLDIEKHIRMKMEYNQSRAYRHGKAY